ncbi:MAG: TetR/AcrR family transcriptional regulator [Hyphomonas sp.]|nr:TetR/AcrR family transcriptional regulator [Hyphomonas sp.]
MPQPQSKTRLTILTTADRLFSRRGIQAVGVDEIAREAGFTKRTLYYHFPTKDDLIAAWLDYTSALTAPPAALEEMAPEAAIMAMFGGLAKTLSNGYRGCPFILTTAELVGASPAIADVVSRHKQARRAWFAHTLERGGIPSKRAMTTAERLMVLWEGAWASSVVFGDGSPIKAAQDMASAVLAEAYSPAASNPQG